MMLNALLLAFRALRRNVMRSLLTMLGIAHREIILGNTCNGSGPVIVSVDSRNLF